MDDRRRHGYRWGSIRQLFPAIMARHAYAKALLVGVSWEWGDWHHAWIGFLLGYIGKHVTTVCTYDKEGSVAWDAE